jgi:general secretion pathway protein A
MSELYRASGGVPRLLNVIGDRALLGGYTEDRHVVNASLVRRAAAEISGHRVLPAWLPWLAGGAAALLLTTTTWFVWHRQQATAAPPEAQVMAEAPAPAPSPAPAPAPPPDLSASLRASTTTDTDSAYRQLFALWSAPYVAGSEEACLQAANAGLACLQETGGLDALRRYNRPALLALADDDGAMHQAVITALGDSSAQLQLGDTAHEVSLAEFEPHWNGEFLMLWRPTLDGPGNLSLGMSGEPVQHLRLRLMRAMGIEPEQVPPAEILSTDFDASLQWLVLEFQREHGLVQDGVAGSRTRALLDSQLADSGTPLLSMVIR